jgi:hypothetical protein
MPGVTMTEHDVSAGPFEREPVELGVALSGGFDAAVPGAEIERRTAAWLAAVLEGHGVGLGAADREIVALLAGEGWSVAQVVGGWVRRAGVSRPAGSTTRSTP